MLAIEFINMNECILLIKRISKLDYRFIIGKKQYAKVEFEAILTNKSKIKLFAYDKIADYIYKKEPKIFWVMGKIREDMNVEITEIYCR